MPGTMAEEKENIGSHAESCIMSSDKSWAANWSHVDE